VIYKIRSRTTGDRSLRGGAFFLLGLWLRKGGQLMNTKSVTVTELHHQLHAVLREVSEETAITISHRGKPVAVLISPTVYETLRGDEPSPGWPAGYFEETYGALAEDPLERPP
jgi:prevent-host-death family protein